MIMNFLKENNGKSSSNRLVFFIGMIWAMFMATMVMFIGAKANWEPASLMAAITGVFAGTSGVFATLKLTQKPMETKNKKNEDNES